jgi:hypothetical protein
MDIQPEPEITESPRKRLKSVNDQIHEDQDVILVRTPPQAQTGASVAVPAGSNGVSHSQPNASKEAEVGIIHFVSAETSGFSGILKKR